MVVKDKQELLRNLCMKNWSALGLVKATTIVDESGKEIKETNPLQTKKLRKYREWAWSDSICRKEHRLIARENPSIFPLGKVYNSIA